MSPAIEIKNLRKEFRIRQEGQRKTFVALDDLNLQVATGNILGLIGHNGAGKSTLLKILSRITYPTAGEVILRGKLSSLLEVGTGFHPELSGRENIYLNGSILGMKRREIQSKMDEIIDFSGVEQFIDTPVKHYSSGMYVRLAFSVAAHLTPDILLIDEVLAVGDAAFQDKCLRKVESSSDEGRTVIFVSHNMSAIRQLCQEVAWIDHGRIKELGSADDVTANYLKSMESKASDMAIAERRDRGGNGEVRLSDLRWKTENDVLVSGAPAQLEVSYHSPQLLRLGSLNFRINIFKKNGEYLTTLSNAGHGFSLDQLDGSGTVICDFDALPLNAGEYYITTNIYHNQEKADKLERGLNFKVEEGNYSRAGANMNLPRAGARVPQNWKLKP